MFSNNFFLKIFFQQFILQINWSSNNYSRKNTGAKTPEKKFLQNSPCSPLAFVQVYKTLESNKKQTFLQQLKANGLTNLKWFGQYTETRSEDKSTKQEVLEGWFTGSFVALFRYVFLPFQSIVFSPKIVFHISD